ncbi:hypothetical protein EMCRGX_G007813 [Ephydatia muelleri]
MSDALLTFQLNAMELGLIDDKSIKATDRAKLKCDVDILMVITNSLKSLTTLRSWAQKDPTERSTLQLVKSRLKEDDGAKEYQGRVYRTLNSVKPMFFLTVRGLKVEGEDGSGWSVVVKVVMEFFRSETKGMEANSVGRKRTFFALVVVLWVTRTSQATYCCILILFNTGRLKRDGNGSVSGLLPDDSPASGSNR